MSVIPTISDFEKSFESRGWLHIELRSRGVDDDPDEFAEWPLRVGGFERHDPFMDFGEHLLLGGAHGLEDRLAPDYSRDYSSGPLFRDPETRRR